MDEDFDNDTCLSPFGELANYWNERNERNPVPSHSPPFSPSYPSTQTHCVMEVDAPDVLELGGHGRQTLGPALYVSCVHAMIENITRSKLFSEASESSRESSRKKRPRPRPILGLIQIACIALCRGVHTAPRY